MVSSVIYTYVSKVANIGTVVAVRHNRAVFRLSRKVFVLAPDGGAVLCNVVVRVTF